MRVLQGCVRYPPAPGGAESHVAAVAEGLTQRGHAVEVHTTNLVTETPFVRRHLPSRVRDVPVVRHRAWSPSGEAHYVFAPGMLSGFLQTGADVIHTHSYGYFQNHAGWLRRRLQGTPWVVTPHFHPPWSMWGGPKRARLRWLYDRLLGRTTLAGADAIICVSRHEQEQLERYVGCDASKVTVIPNGIRWRDWATPPQGDAFHAAHPEIGEPLVLFAGRLATNKGLFHLLRAMRELRRHHHSAELVLVGADMGLGPELDRQAAAERVPLHRLGHISDPLYRSAMAAADVLVLPSEYEAFGIVLLEAAAAGTPTVAAEVGGTPEALARDETGLLVAYGDAHALAEAVDSLLANPQRAREMGRKGRQRVQRYFTWEAIVPRIEHLYRSLVG